MCDKCKFMGSVGNCENQKADMFRHPCPGIHGADVHDCPYVEIAKNCSGCALNADCSEVDFDCDRDGVSE